MSTPFSVKDIAAILEMLQKHDVTEFRMERGEEKLFLRRGEPQRARRSGPKVHPVLSAVPTLAPGLMPSNVVPLMAAPQELAPQMMPQRVAEHAIQPVATAEPVRATKALREITSPMVGTFYRRPAVDAEPYVDEGDTVKKGDVLCIVEAMKLMNEIESDVAGRIVEICLEDGQMVEYGEVLFRIEPA